MFGYVLPLKGELKVKDYEKFKAYYCGLCLSIKKNYGTIPRLAVNYDMTFVAILLDALESEPCKIHSGNCIAHPLQKKNFIINNSALDYASFLNVALAYFKLTDDVKDDKSKVSSLSAFFLKNYFKKFPKKLKVHSNFIREKLNELYKLEDSQSKVSIDELSHPFAELTAFVLSSYPKLKEHKDILYTLGYNLGKWIYIIDAFDDLEEDMRKGKFNAVASIFNTDNLPFKEFKIFIKDRIDFILVTCARSCFECLNKLPLKTNKDILYNILQLGLLEKMDRVFILK
ncbi:DUF5685 family protein [Clostridium pasteurianum]|uniref:DUF5685 family protein n=1 Tax=Clostridium pasteurianum TaxID=1501 RepID=UPI0022608ECD|nr:DUF5685 family protein [Clostridium pasteurianum]UZW15583.1 DUF5685 family protein [Clostridium pasteurianum]